MKKIMISQPMRGLTNEQILANRERVVKELTEKGYEVIDTVISEYPGEINKQVPIWYLGKSIQFLSTVDELFMMKDWEEARGCKIEHEIALQYGLKVLYE